MNIQDLFPLGWTGTYRILISVVLEKTLESPLDCKEIQPVHPKGYQSWVFIGRTGVEAETPILWPPDTKSWPIGKDADAGKDWGQEEKGMAEDEMVGWHHWLDGHVFGWTLGIGNGQGGLACCGPWGCRVGQDWATELNWTEYLFYIMKYRTCWTFIFLMVSYNTPWWMRANFKLYIISLAYLWIINSQIYIYSKWH